MERTPEKAAVLIPCGHILVSSKWRNTELTNALTGRVQLIYEENLGHIDFAPASHVGVVYASEADLVATAHVRRKLAKLRKDNALQVVVLAEMTSCSSQHYQELQRFVVMELGFSIVPVPGPSQAAGLLEQMVLSEGRLESNPFKKRRAPARHDEALLSTVQSIKNLGAVKARKLLAQYKSLAALNDASESELCAVVGKSSAQVIRQFLQT